MPLKYVVAALEQYCAKHRMDSNMPLTVRQALEVYKLALSLMEKDATEPQVVAQ